jgi:hypothetical protein
MRQGFLEYKTLYGVVSIPGSRALRRPSLDNGKMNMGDT